MTIVELRQWCLDQGFIKESENYTINAMQRLRESYEEGYGFACVGMLLNCSKAVELESLCNGNAPYNIGVRDAIILIEDLKHG